MKNNILLAVLTSLAMAGCQTTPFLTPNVESTDAWNVMALDQAQFISEENGFTCLAPTGVDFDGNGQAVRKTLCVKDEACTKTTRTFYMEAHSMNLIKTTETVKPVQGCSVPAPSPAK